MFVKGDKVKAIAPILGNTNVVGEIGTITDINYDTGLVAYKFDNFSSDGVMSINVFSNYFEEYEEVQKENSFINISDERVNLILENSEFEVDTVFDKCIVVSCKLPNGYVIVESFNFVDPSHYDEDRGADICISKIADKIWELESYLTQNYEDYEDEDYEEPICEDCEDYECEFNPNNPSSNNKN